MRKAVKYVWGLLAAMTIGLSACGDDEATYSDQELAYIKQNRMYLWEKKAARDEKGNLIYQQVVMNGDTALYRIVKKEHDWKTTPSASSLVYLEDLEGKFIDGQVFQPKLESSSFLVNGIIPGLGAILMRTHLDETIEAIIPASLGYGFIQFQHIPAGSTLVFTYTLDKVE